LPFSLQEITGESKSASLDEIMWKGFYPRIHDERLNAADALSFYVDTYLNRDVREVENVKNLRSFSIFLRTFSFVLVHKISPLTLIEMVLPPGTAPRYGR
jgi:hypothetical protein